MSQISAGMSSGPPEDPQLLLPAPPLVLQPEAALASTTALTAGLPRRRSAIDTKAGLLMARALGVSWMEQIHCESRAKPPGLRNQALSDDVAQGAAVAISTKRTKGDALPAGALIWIWTPITDHFWRCRLIQGP